VTHDGGMAEKQRRDGEAAASVGGGKNFRSADGFLAFVFSLLGERK
jgi:hypothetical protein